MRCNGTRLAASLNSWFNGFTKIKLLKFISVLRNCLNLISLIFSCSPQSQLRQHGVYLANTQPPTPTPTPTVSHPSHAPHPHPRPSSSEIMRRNQEIQRQIKERKEAHDDGGFQVVTVFRFYLKSRFSLNTFLGLKRYIYTFKVFVKN